LDSLSLWERAIVLLGFLSLWERARVRALVDR